MNEPPFDATGGTDATPQAADKPKRARKPRVVGGTEAREHAPPFDPNEEPLPAKYTEVSAANQFAESKADSLKYVSEWGRWMEWDGIRWRRDNTLLAYDLIKKTCTRIADAATYDKSISERQRAIVPLIYGSAKTISNVEKIAKASRVHASKPDQWDQDIWALNTPSGIIDLTSGVLRPSERTEHLTKVTGASLGGDCPAWLGFLNVVTQGDRELEGFLKRICGYCLTGSTRDHAMFFLYGTGRNGKGTFLSVLQNVLGDYTQTAGMDVFTEDKGTKHPTELAGLMGARMVCAQETEQGKRWAESRIKALTGGDKISARFMRQDFFEFVPQFKIIIAGNHKPRLRNVDEAIKARMNLIPFTYTIPPEDRDPKLILKLEAEHDGILRWCVEGCLEWLEIGLKAPKCVQDATAEYLSQQDTLAVWIDQECTRDAKSRGRTSALYKSYSAYATNQGEYVISQESFKEKLESRGIRCASYGGYPTAFGIDLKKYDLLNQ